MFVKIALCLGVFIVGISLIVVGMLEIAPEVMAQLGLNPGNGPNNPFGVIFCLFGLVFIRLGVWIYQSR